MDGSVLFAVFLTQIWSIPMLVILVVGAVFTLRHGTQEKFVQYAVSGFSLLALSVLFSAGQQYWMFALLREEGRTGAEVAGQVYGMKVMLLHRALYLGGLGLLVAAIVEGRPKRRAARSEVI